MVRANALKHGRRSVRRQAVARWCHDLEAVLATYKDLQGKELHAAVTKAIHALSVDDLTVDGALEWLAVRSGRAPAGLRQLRLFCDGDQ